MYKVSSNNEIVHKHMRNELKATQKIHTKSKIYWKSV